MRNLTIKRKKKTVGCAAKVLFYIEDAANPEVYLNTIPCRKLGELKNGEEKTFSITEDAVQVFVAPAFGQTQPGDILPIAAGTEDVTTSGEVFVNSTGGTFRFDDSPFEKPSKKRGVLGFVGFILGAVVIGLVLGVLGNLPRLLPKTFTLDNLQITLTRNFKETKQEGFDYCLDGGYSALLFLKDSFDSVEGVEELTEEEYLDLTLYANGMEDEVKEKEGRPYFSYTNGEYRYYCFGYKSDDAFWLVQIIVLEENADNLEGRVFKWANTVTFVS